LVDKARLYEFQIANSRFDPVIKMLLRLYGGQLSTDFTKISESYLAKALQIPVDELITLLKHLHDLKLIMYYPVKDKPQITFTLPRQDVEHLLLNRERLRKRKELAELKMKAMVEFVTSTKLCRMQLIQEYFGEEVFQTCGTCDVCIAGKKNENQLLAKELHDEILSVLKDNLYTIDQLEERIAPKDNELFVEVIREMVDEGDIEYDDIWRLRVCKL
jgi:ATP-dependent DNA helicase RecQ